MYVQLSLSAIIRGCPEGWWGLILVSWMCWCWEEHFRNIAVSRQKRYWNICHFWDGLVTFFGRCSLMAVALSGTVFIDRANRSSALKTFDNAVKQMNQDKVLPSPHPYVFWPFSKVSGYFPRELVHMLIIQCSSPSRKEPSISLFRRVYPSSLS